LEKNQIIDVRRDNYYFRLAAGAGLGCNPLPPSGNFASPLILYLHIIIIITFIWADARISAFQTKGFVFELDIFLTAHFV
jgi:hypothetical protein